MYTIESPEDGGKAPNGPNFPLIVTLFAVAILVILGIGYLAVPDFARHLFPHKQSHATSQVDVAGGLVRAA